MNIKTKSTADQKKSNKINYDLDLLKKLHNKMLLIRRFEEKNRG